MQHNTQTDDLTGLRAKLSAMDRGHNPVEQRVREILRRGVAAAKLGHVIQIAEIELADQPSQEVGRAPDIHDNAVAVEVWSPEFDINDIRSPVQALRRPEYLTCKA